MWPHRAIGSLSVQLPWRRAAWGGDQEGRLTWYRTEVDGRPASYGVGGPAGLSVVFLHGWGLGSRTYKRAVNRLMARGCRVYAPALPSFGGTADLPGEQMTMAGYADWVASFMDSVGIDEPVLLIGHSFGGGVAITVADRHADRVSYLVLLNAVGALPGRPPWAWVTAFGREMWPAGHAVELLEAIRQDVMANVVRNPLGMMRAARLAQQADLREELTSLRSSGLPVLVLTSDHDAVIPRGAFDALCTAVGTAGQVVYGGHSWLLADPDSFDEVLGAFVDLQVAQHRATRAPGRAAEVRRLLRGTQVPPHAARSLLRGASPLWLMSEPPEVLAADVALCFPKLAPAEVRAAARPVEGSKAVRLTIAAIDRRGLLADSTAVLAANGISIRRAAATTWRRRHLALQSFVIDNAAQLDEAAWQSLGEELRKMVEAGVIPTAVNPVGRIDVEVKGSGAGRSLIEVKGPDRVGLLSAVSRCFAELGADIESVHARAAKGVAHATFVVIGDLDAQAISERLLAPAA